MMTIGEPAFSGVVYHVTEVSGQPPRELSDFVGDVTFTAVSGTLSWQIQGSGARIRTTVRFNEKDASDQNFRVWLITIATVGQFEAMLV